jgi:hypothetical protein
MCREEIHSFPAYVHKRVDSLVRVARGERPPAASNGGG